MPNNRDHLSEVQALCTNLSVEEPELVLGSIYGLREWFVYGPSVFGDKPPYTRLVGHFCQPWQTDEPHEAECRALGRTLYLRVDVAKIDHPDDIQFEIRTRAAAWFDEVFAQDLTMDPATARARLSFSDHLGTVSARQDVDWLLDDPFMERNIRIPLKFQTPAYPNGRRTASLTLTTKRKKHQPGDPECTCGIYAYHDLESLNPSPRSSYRSASFGLIEASGNVTVGTKGFRAQRATILALTIPYPTATVYGEVTQAAVDRWTADGITVLPDLAALLVFAEQGGYLKKPKTPPDS